MHTVLVADADKSFNQVLSSKVNSETSCRVVAEVYDGKSAIAMIESQRPDIIIIDFILPETDGLYVVEYIRCCIRDYNPLIYVLSHISNEIILDKFNALQVDFFNLKPISFDHIMRNLKLIANLDGDKKSDIQIFPQRHSLQATVNDLVMQFGVYPHRLSTKCVADALACCAENPDSIQMLTKALYPAIGEKYNISGSAVEKNIRSAIEIMQKAQSPLFMNLFPHSDCKRVTNGEFLATVTYYLDKLPAYVKNCS